MIFREKLSQIFGPFAWLDPKKQEFFDSEIKSLDDVSLKDRAQSYTYESRNTYIIFGLGLLGIPLSYAAAEQIGGNDWAFVVGITHLTLSGFGGAVRGFGRYLEKQVINSELASRGPFKSSGKAVVQI